MSTKVITVTCYLLLGTCCVAPPAFLLAVCCMYSMSCSVQRWPSSFPPFFVTLHRVSSSLFSVIQTPCSSFQTLVWPPSAAPPPGWGASRVPAALMRTKRRSERCEGCEGCVLFEAQLGLRKRFMPGLKMTLKYVWTKFLLFDFHVKLAAAFILEKPRIKNSFVFGLDSQQNKNYNRKWWAQKWTLV